MSSVFSSFENITADLLGKVARLRKRREMRDALRRLRETPDGKLVIDWLLRESGVTRPVAHEDPYKAQFAEGKRHLGMSLLTLMTSEDPSNLIAELERDPAMRNQK